MSSTEQETLTECRPRPLSPSMREDSTCSRQGLRRDLKAKRSALTNKEHSFLERLVIHGNEIEVEIARKRLNDDALFPTDQLTTIASAGDREDESIHGNDNDADTTAVTATAVTADVEQSGGDFGPNIRIGREISAPSTLDVTIETDLTPTSKSSSHPATLLSSTTSRGSQKSQKHLLSRKNSEMFEKMWLAHENGLGFTEASARRSIVRRSSGLISIKDDGSVQSSIGMTRNMSFLSASTAELILQGGPINRPGESAIFRHQSISTATHKTLSPGIPRIIRPIYGNMPPLPLDRETSTSSSIPKPSSVMRSVSERPASKRPPKIPGPESLMRSTSERSRKSVSFLQNEDTQFPERIISRRMSPKVPRRIVTRDRQASIGDESLGDYSASGGIISPGGPREERKIFSSISTIASAQSQETPLPVPPFTDDGDDIDSSLRSAPSLHHANPVNSPGGRSIPSLHRAQPVKSMDSTSTHSADNSRLPAWAINKFDADSTPLIKNSASTKRQKPVLFRQVSKNTGEGIEVTEISEVESVNKARTYNSMLSMASSVKTSLSFDTATDMRVENIFRNMPTSLSDDDISNYFLGTTSKFIFALMFFHYFPYE